MFVINGEKLTFFGNWPKNDKMWQTPTPVERPRFPADMHIGKNSLPLEKRTIGNLHTSGFNLSSSFFSNFTVSWLQLYLYSYSLMHKLVNSTKYLNNYHGTSSILWFSVAKMHKIAFHLLSVSRSHFFIFTLSLSAVYSLIRVAYKMLIWF